MSEDMLSNFVAGFAGRRDAAGAALRQAYAAKSVAFAPRDITPTPPGDPAQPRHFSPADAEADPTEDWDPFDANQPNTGFIDPLTTARAQGYEEGLAAALANGGRLGERDQALLDGLVAAIADDRRVDRDRLAAHLRSTVLTLVTRMVGEAGIDADLLTRRIANAATMIGDDAESALLRMHPEDMPLVEGKLPDHIFPVADPHLTRGHFALESAATIVEDGPDLWLEQIAQAIERAGLPD
ncbi:flagellar biosynthesis protein FliH [Sphingomonas sp.]|jgi:flagellar assembly protein FliH|uniref:FliH/SctL family protein n=1 Tax=Sphingomonas sp. TaxID=28214 RepID=UPI002E3036BE|nr:flagellar biosynthesis protein FliH [Sphingomonas sp.]HEX4694595.1 flagellar biosynthesis protein FliH [Sphingomonas sp.]